ncbi:hypothetical protein B0T17DRAFT_527268 [Bombardia bombarda]|uniref:Secreted protein n=1 Tax=Bombardia bombarda TaxID=252184 RepID=A0AA39XAS5_9PEZI|nr:hypothetical protein B0T17DRAFT_527268 [Bombardia bombarda]
MLCLLACLLAPPSSLLLVCPPTTTTSTTTTDAYTLHTAYKHACRFRALAPCMHAYIGYIQTRQTDTLVCLMDGAGSESFLLSPIS